LWVLTRGLGHRLVQILDLLLQHFEQTQQVGATQDGPMLRDFLKGRMRAV
jgi:hypothetical protein